jgi:hypothetical protein
MKSGKAALLIIILNCFLSIQCSSQHVNAFYNPSGNTIENRINTPNNFKRASVSPNSYASYLRTLPLKEHGSKVYLYNGQLKSNQSTAVAVINLDVGTRDLQQCADAVMRVRAEYLFKEKKYSDIHFNFTNGFKVDYSNWMKGQRIVVDGNKTYWAQKTQASNSYESFRKYMTTIFIYAGTLSLEKELVSVPVHEIEIGDVFIQGGSPGHAVFVVDLAVNDHGEKVFLLAQSYMPAQDIHVLSNPNSLDGSPWYSIPSINKLETPEWIFNLSDLKRFGD